jgi:DNA-binding protein HU-beta
MSIKTKNDLINELSKDSGLSKADVAKALDSLTNIMTSSLKEVDGVVALPFGKIKVQKREAREARNPRTGEPVKVPACNVVKFTPSKLIVDAVNS